MSIRMKLANWLSGEDVAVLRRWGDSNAREVTRLREQRSEQANAIYAQAREVAELRAAHQRIYEIPCTEKSSGSLKRARKIAAHALWKE